MTLAQYVWQMVVSDWAICSRYRDDPSTQVDLRVRTQRGGLLHLRRARSGRLRRCAVAPVEFHHRQPPQPGTPSPRSLPIARCSQLPARDAAPNWSAHGAACDFRSRVPQSWLSSIAFAQLPGLRRRLRRGLRGLRRWMIRWCSRGRGRAVPSRRFTEVIAGVGIQSDQRRGAGHQAQHGGSDTRADGHQHQAALAVETSA